MPNTDNYTQCIKAARLNDILSHLPRACAPRFSLSLSLSLSLIVCTRVWTCQERVSVTTPRVSGFSQFWRCMRPYWNAQRLVATVAVMSAPIGTHIEVYPDVPLPRPISRPHVRHDKRFKVRRYAGLFTVRVCNIPDTKISLVHATRLTLKCWKQEVYNFMRKTRTSCFFRILLRSRVS